MGFEIKGFSELRDSLESMAARAGTTAAEAALKAGAKPIFDDMKRQASIDPKVISGNLRDSIKIGRITQTTRKKDYKTAKRITIGSHAKEMGAFAPHAPLVEFGHGGPAPAPPHPFVRSAYDRKSTEAFAEMKRVLEQKLFE